jgi:hypothetical protein
MAELVDASDSKSDSARSAGSIPARGTILSAQALITRAATITPRFFTPLIKSALAKTMLLIKSLGCGVNICAIIGHGLNTAHSQVGKYIWQALI